MITGTIDNDTPHQLAEQFVAAVGPAGITLDYSPESLKSADRVLDELAGHGFANDSERMRMVEFIGSYYGEVIRRNIGGNWYYGIGEDSACGLVLDVETEHVVWCYATVAKEIMGGKDKSLWAIYQLIRGQFA